MMDPHSSVPNTKQCNMCKTNVVQTCCEKCLVNLRKTSDGEHVSDQCKNHKGVTSTESILLNPGCTSHEKEGCVMYCNECHRPVCSTCLESNEHLGHGLSKISHIWKEKKENIMKSKKELYEELYPAYQNIVSDAHKKMSELKRNCGDLSAAITKQGEKWHRDIDKIVEKLKAEAEEMKTTQLDTLRKYVEDVNKKISDINDEINSLDVALNSSDMSKVFNVIPNVDQYKELPQNIWPSLPQFTPGTIQEEKLCVMFGTLSPTSAKPQEHDSTMKTTQKPPEAASSPVKQLQDEPQTDYIHTEYKYNLYNVACLGEEEIWTSGDNSTMKLFSINKGSLLRSIATKSNNVPDDIAVTNGGDLVYTDKRDRTVNIVKNIEINLEKWKPNGVCSTSSNDLLVTMISDDETQFKVARYSGSIETQTYQFDDQRQPLYLSAHYISENRNQDICVSDCIASAVVVVNRAGKLRFRYTAGHISAPKSEPFDPQGITTDSQNHILTADNNNDCVHIIDQDGQFLRYIDCGLRGPWGLCIDTNDNLYIAQYYNKRVKKVKYQPLNRTNK